MKTSNKILYAAILSAALYTSILYLDNYHRIRPLIPCYQAFFDRFEQAEINTVITPDPDLIDCGTWWDGAPHLHLQLHNAGPDALEITGDTLIIRRHGVRVIVDKTKRIVEGSAFDDAE